MTEAEKPLQKKSSGLSRVLRLVTLAAAFAVRFININGPLYYQPHSFRQAQTLITVQSFLNDGLKIIGYQTPVMGPPWTIPFEFPVYQVIVYLVLKLTGMQNITLCANIVSIVIFMLTAGVLWKFICEFVNQTVADITAIVFLFMPYDILWSRAALIDYLSVLLALVYVYSFIKVLNGKRKYAFAALISGILAYLCKSTTMFPYAFLLGVIIIVHFVRKKRIDYSFDTLLLIAICILPVIPVVFWNIYTDAVKLSGNIGMQHLATGSLNSWLFASPMERLTPACWKMIGYRIYNMCGQMWIPVLFVLYLVNRNRPFLKRFLLSIVSPLFVIIVCFNLFYVHSYYLISVTPFLAFALGIMVYNLFLLMKKFTLPAAITAVVIVLLGAFASDAINRDKIMHTDPVNKNSFDYISRITREDDCLIMNGYDWSPVYLYCADRKGYMIWEYEDYDLDFQIENAIVPDKDIYKAMVGNDIDQSLAVIDLYPDNIQFVANDYDLVARFLPEQAAREYLGDSGTWDMLQLSDNILTVPSPENTLLKIVRDSVEGEDFIYADVTCGDGTVIETLVLYADESDTAYFDLTGLEGPVSIRFYDAQVEVYSTNRQIDYLSF